MLDNIIEFKHVVKEYTVGENKLKAVDNISFDIKQGEFVVILGPSGAEKSTLLNLLGGMDFATSGEIIVDGKNIVKAPMNPKEVLSSVGLSSHENQFPTQLSDALDSETGIVILTLLQKMSQEKNKGNHCK